MLLPRRTALLATTLLAVTPPAAAQHATEPAPPGIACPATATAMARLELVFGTTRPGGAPVSEDEWQAFLDEVVTPRFPDGLTVLSGYGQYRAKNGKIVKEGAKLLLVWHLPSGDSEARIEAVRAAYKERFGQESVLRADGLSCVGF